MDDSSKKLTRSIAKIGGILFLAISFFSIVLIGSLSTLGISFFAISGNSMNPTFEDKDSVVVKSEKLIDNDQIIFFHKPSAWDDYVITDSIFVKRVIAKPGDSLHYDSGSKSLYVNDSLVYQLPDSYECIDKDYDNVLTNEQVFVMGDNRTDSLDSLRILCDGNNPNDAYIPKKDMVNYGHVIFKF